MTAMYNMIYTIYAYDTYFTWFQEIYINIKMLFFVFLQRLINTLDYSNVWRLTGWHTIVMNYTVKDIDV